MSHLVSKPTKCHVRPAKTQISLGIRPVWLESSLCAQRVAKGPSFLHADSEDSDQTGRSPGWSESSLGALSFCWFCHEAAHITFLPGWKNFGALVMPRHQKVAGYYVIPSEILSVRPSVRLSVRPSAPTIILVSATPPTVLGQSFWNFTGVLRMVWRYAYCFFRILKLFFITFFPFLTDIFRALILQICIWSMYLVSATPPTVFGESFWNFTGVLRMVWRYAYCFFRILKLFFITFFAFLT